MRIAIIGFMAAGKSTVGRQVAKRLNIPFVDLDDFIVSTAGMTVETIFREVGEEGFRKLEVEALTRLRDSAHVVCATGGGVVTQDSARRVLRRDFCTIWLEIDAKSVIERLEHDKTVRPVLTSEETLLTRVQNLMEARTNWYMSLANYRCQVTGRSVDEVVEDIVGYVASLT